MKTSSRRNVLAKLGAGAVAATAFAASGTAAAGPKTKKAAIKPTKLKPINPRRAVKFRATGEQLAVTVQLSPKNGGFIINSKPGTMKAVGVASDGNALNLAVKASGGSISIAGLDSVLNRATEAGRCWIDTSEAAQSVAVQEHAF